MKTWKGYTQRFQEGKGDIYLNELGVTIPYSILQSAYDGAKDAKTFEEVRSDFGAAIESFLGYPEYISTSDWDRVEEFLFDRVTPKTFGNTKQRSRSKSKTNQGSTEPTTEKVMKAMRNLKMRSVKFSNLSAKGNVIFVYWNYSTKILNLQGNVEVDLSQFWIDFDEGAYGEEFTTVEDLIQKVKRWIQEEIDQNKKWTTRSPGLSDFD